jgi:hypothetical protein
MTTHWNKIGCLNVLGTLALLAVAALPVPAADRASPAPDSSQTVALEYHETSHAMTSWSVFAVNQSAPFSKEPPLAGSKIRRGTLNFGDEATNNLAFRWDKTAGKLFLDLNRNGDLTDDAAGRLAASELATPDYCTFTNALLSFKTAVGDRQFLVDLTLRDAGSSPHCSVQLRSFWQGRMVLDNEEWQLGVIENVVPVYDARSQTGVDRHLLLRPWAERDRAFDTFSGTLDVFPFEPKIFFRGHTFALSLTNDPAGSASALSLRLAEERPALGELKITGQFIHRLILERGPCTVIVTPPVGTVRIPAGTYNQVMVWLKNGGAEACGNRTAGSVAIHETKPAELVIGGPLTNSVSPERRGRNLRLSYTLVGAGGDAYQLIRQDRSQPPTFAAFKDGKQVGSGKFEFG